MVRTALVFADFRGSGGMGSISELARAPWADWKWCRTPQSGGSPECMAAARLSRCSHAFEAFHVSVCPSLKGENEPKNGFFHLFGRIQNSCKLIEFITTPQLHNFKKRLQLHFIEKAARSAENSKSLNPSILHVCTLLMCNTLAACARYL